MLTRIVISSAIGAVLAYLIIIPLNTIREFSPILEDPNNIISQKDKGVLLLDRNNKPFFHFYEAKAKRIVSLNDVPEHMKQALIATEDRTFYNHHGFSIRGIARSAYMNYKHKQIFYGGSTISQQVVKTTLLTPDKNFIRKYKELVLAVVLERLYTKDQILEMYFNTAYFGEGAFGVEEAAQTYFNKHAYELTLGEASLLSGLLPAPSALSPLSNDKTKAFDRQKIVLQAMVDEGYISTDKKNTVLAEPLSFASTQVTRNNSAPHFALMVLNQLIDSLGEQQVVRSGLRVQTTLDLDWQERATVMLANHVESLKSQRVTNGAVTIIDPATHEVRALVGSVNWFHDKFGTVNMAASPRQTGSAFKPVVYAAALEARAIDPLTVLQDKPTTFGKDYRPLNYDKRFRGPVLVRRALANSLNVPAVSVLQQVGVSGVTQLASAMGITTLEGKHDYDLSIALGSGEIPLTELTNAYATLADNGQHLPYQTILSITDKRGEEISITNHKKKQVVSPETAFIISSMLADEKARAETFGKALTISQPAAVKTGTSQDYRDSWTMGYTPSLAVGVWLGNNDNTPMTKLSGSMGAAPLWRGLMETFLPETPPQQNFEPPQNVVLTAVCRGSRATEYTLANTRPTRFCPTPKPETPPVDDTGEKPEKPKNKRKPAKLVEKPKPRLPNNDEPITD